MEIELIKLDDLKPYENNPRLNEDAVDGVAASIKEFGFKVPIVIDKNNVIVCGHTRYLASRRLGLVSVPCIKADDLSDDQIKAFRLADNKVSEVAQWDLGKLQIELDDIELDMSDFGFNPINVDDFGTDFELPSGDKSEICQITFTLHEKQKELIEYAMECVADDISETFGNTNRNGNAIYEVVRQWAEQKKSL